MNQKEDRDLGPLRKVYARECVVQRVELELDGLMLDLTKKHGLTYAERFSIISGLLVSCAKFAMRAEREAGD